jgi:hypothetical protein
LQFAAFEDWRGSGAIVFNDMTDLRGLPEGRRFLGPLLRGTEKATEKQAGLHFLLSNHCVSKAHLHTLKHDELRMLITFQVLVAPCPDKKFRSVCTAQAGLSRPSVRS